MIAWRYGLFEDVLDAYLHLPALAVVEGVVIGLRVVFAVGVLLHGELGLVVGGAAFILEDTASVAGLCGDFLHTPAAVEQVAEVHDVEAELDGVFGLTHLELEFFHETEVELVNPGCTGCICLGILAAVTVEVLVLVDE